MAFRVRHDTYTIEKLYKLSVSSYMSKFSYICSVHANNFNQTFSDQCHRSCVNLLSTKTWERSNFNEPPLRTSVPSTETSLFKSLMEITWLQLTKLIFFPKWTDSTKKNKLETSSSSCEGSIFDWCSRSF